MKAKQDWQFIGRFVAAIVQLFTIISDVFKKAEVGLEVIEWLIGFGKSFLISKLTEIADEYRRQNPLTLIKEVVIDQIIRVDRSIRPSYPSWVKLVMHPELENTGPTEFDVTKLELWLHDDQKTKWVNGTVIYAYQKKADILKTCLGLRDLEEIEKKDIVFFRKHFKGKVIVGWAGFVQDSNGNFYVPFLCERGGKVVLDWHYVGNDFYSHYPSARFAS